MQFMTPAVLFLEKHKASFDLLEYIHDSSHNSFANEASEKLNLPPELIFKTLVIEVDTNRFVVAVIPANKQLSLKGIAKVASGKKAAMAEAKKVQSMSGYVLGGVSPFGQKKVLETFIHESAKGCKVVYVSGGKRGLEIAISPLLFKTMLSANFVNITA
jgi:Cys-tRNA(Pro)/Cys-tRNA(Cys) deacylase